MKDGDFTMNVPDSDPVENIKTMYERLTGKPIEQREPVAGLSSWDAPQPERSMTLHLEPYARQPEPTLTHIPDDGIKKLLRVRSSTRPIGSTLYVKILWDGVHSEPAQPVHLAHRVQRRIRHFERHRHLCRQFFPKRSS